MAAVQEGDDPITAINVTPLVDICLVLLIIFMVTANFIVEPQIKVELPKASSGEPQEPENLAVVVTKDGKLYLDGDEVDKDALRFTLIERLKNTPDVQAVISADKEVMHGRVVEIIDLVRLTGCKRFAINVQPEDEAPNKAPSKKR